LGKKVTLNESGGLCPMNRSSATVTKLAGKSVEVMLLDGDLPDDAGNRLCEELSGGDKPIRVIMLSFSSEPERIVKALRARARAVRR
jgi:DNA-binding NarL/FixJ family response regulator